ncbi:MAG: hypothetical protein HDS35_07640 [Bacteroides sp.]|nr:hypothetical protein [Bacteroides sp.]
MFSGKNKNDQWEDSLLRATILFNNKNNTYSRDALMMKAFYALIAYYEEGIEINSICEEFNRRFSLKLERNEVQRNVANLEKDKMVICDPHTDIIKITDDIREGGEFYQNLERDTETILDNIVMIVRSEVFNKLNNRDINKIKENAKEALSIYFHHYGFAYVGLKKEVKAQNDIEYAVERASKDLENRVAASLIGALCNLLMEPSEEEKLILEKWARAYVTMEILNLDPTLRNFRITKLRDKTFVLDTDIVLHGLCSHAKYSSDYRYICEKLKSAGSKFVLPYKVLKEVETHIKQAKNNYWYKGVRWEDMSDELLENENVFIEDFVKRKRANPEERDMNIQTYLDNLYSPQAQYLLKDRIKEFIGDEFIMWEENCLVDLGSAEGKQLAEKIKVRTETSKKGERREARENEDLANTDAQLYLTIKKKNKDCESAENQIGFAQSYYLLTRSRKIKQAAIEIFKNDASANCISHPGALLAILQEIGYTNGRSPEFLNLFENPFLAYTADRIREEIQPLLDNNIQLKYEDVKRLRVRSEENLRNLLITDGKGRDEVIEPYARNEFLFAKEYKQERDKTEKIQKELSQEKKENENLKNQVEILEKKLAILRNLPKGLQKAKEKKQLNSKKRRVKRR